MNRTATLPNYQATQLKNTYKEHNFIESKLTNDFDKMKLNSAFNYRYARLPPKPSLNFVGKSYVRPPSNIDLHADFQGGFDRSLTSSNKLDNRIELKTDKIPISFLP